MVFEFHQIIIKLIKVYTFVLVGKGFPISHSRVRLLDSLGGEHKMGTEDVLALALI